MELARRSWLVLHHGGSLDGLPHLADSPECALGVDELGDGRLQLLGACRSHLRNGHVLVHAPAGARSDHLPVRRHRHVRSEEVSLRVSGRVRDQRCGLIPDEDGRVRCATEGHRRVARQQDLDSPCRRYSQGPDPCHREHLEAAGPLIRQVHDPLWRPGLANIRARRDSEALSVAVLARNLPGHALHRPHGVDWQLLPEEE
mmetsp:Transcript_13819/g.39798  ORF Transcript_13819/g.39798 Transcript_13819/m.39798 type:complete len:201 (-) Transcript_13819:294-896(-)